MCSVAESLPSIVGGIGTTTKVGGYRKGKTEGKRLWLGGGAAEKSNSKAKPKQRVKIIHIWRYLQPFQVYCQFSKGNYHFQ